MKYLIVGLGNVGAEYDNTRHNIGFAVADHIAAQKGVAFLPSRYGSLASCSHKGRLIKILKPDTYMNLSGKAVNYWVTKEKIQPENLLVILDDLALPKGVLRLRASGRGGGHNGLESIILALGSTHFPRLRFGIGADYPKGAQVQYVLERWGVDEIDLIAQSISDCFGLVTSFVTEGVQRTMNVYNKKKH